MNAFKKESLFICNSDCILLDDPKIKPIVIDCTTYVRTKLQQRTTYFYHPLFANEFQKWPTKTDIACFHCCEFFQTTPYPSVRRYDEIKNIYYVYGVFCSLHCVKAYMIEHEPALSTLRLSYFTQMCRDVYGVYESVAPAYPRMRLKRFGGDLTLEEFRKKFTIPNTVMRMVEPPFLQSPVAFEETKMSYDKSMNQILDPKDQQSVYDAYIAEKGVVIEKQAEEIPKEIQKKEKRPPKRAKKEKQTKKPAEKRKRKAKDEIQERHEPQSEESKEDATSNATLNAIPTATPNAPPNVPPNVNPKENKKEEKKKVKKQREAKKPPKTKQNKMKQLPAMHNLFKHIQETKKN